MKVDATVYHLLGALYYNTGRLPDSHQMFHYAVHLEPGDIDSLCSYVSISKENPCYKLGGYLCLITNC